MSPTSHSTVLQLATIIESTQDCLRVRLADGTMTEVTVLDGITAEDLARAITDGYPAVVGELAGRQIVLGFLARSLPAPRQTAVPDAVTIEAGRTLVLRAGNASLTLTAAGKVLTKGRYVHSQSSGDQVIRGAAVKIN